MNESDASAAPTFIDHADWRLIVHISTGRLRAYLVGQEATEKAPAPVVDTRWEAPEEADQLRGVEAAVYATPALLDDYEADIVLQTSSSIFVPAEALSQPGDAELLYAPLRELPEEDIFETTFGAISTLSCPAKGLHSFLDRTFAGARVAPHLAVIENYLRNQTKHPKRLYVNIDATTADILAFDGTRLLCGATHEWHAHSDIVYHTFQAFAACGFAADDATILLSGEVEACEAVREMLRGHVDRVEDATLPRVADGGEIPLAVALLMARKPNSEQ